MSTAQALKEITQYGLSKEELYRDYGISLSTQSNYTKKTKTPVKRRTAQSKVIEVLHYVLKVISAHQGVNPIKELRELTFEDHMHLSEFLKRFEANDLELLKITIKTQVERKLSEREVVRPLDVFRDKYKFLNDETLEKASISSPELLQGIVLDEKINTLARSHALYALSLGAREELYSFILGFVNHQSPFIRESALMGLFEYYDSDEGKHLEIKEILERKLREEKAIGIKKKIDSLLEQM